MLSLGIASYQKNSNSQCNISETKDQSRSAPIPIRFPKKSASLQNASNDMDMSNTKYLLSTGRSLHDPTIVNTPPTDFMRNLKERMSVYFTPANDETVTM